MYRKQHNGQLSIEEFYLPFGGTLDPEHRWVLLSALMPWEELEETYAPQFSPTVGAPVGHGLRSCPTAASTSMEQQHPLLASAGGGLDQSTASRNRPRTGYVVDGYLTGGRGVIFPGSHRGGAGTSSTGAQGRDAGSGS